VARSELLAPLAVLAVGGVLFASTLGDAVQVADSGELIAVACNGGVAHPPGYPLYTLVGGALCKLPLSTPAGRLALLSLLAALTALLALQGVIARVTGNRWAGAAAALTLATGSVFWRQASVAEVFAGTGALALGALYAAVRCGQAERPGAHLLWSGVAGLLVGLGLSHNHTAIVVAPAVALAVLLPFRSLGQAAGRAGLALLGLGVGLLPYLHLLLASPARVPRWGDTSSWSGLWHHLLRRDYGTFTLTVRDGTAGLANVGFFLKQLPSQTAWLLWLPALFGVAVLLARAAGRRLGQPLEGRLRRDLSAVVALLPLLAGPALLLLFNVPPTGTGAQEVERFHLLPNALLAVCLGIGLAALEAQLLGAAPHTAEGDGAEPSRPASPGQGVAAVERQRRITLWRIAVLALIGVAALGSYPRADASRTCAVEDYARNLLSTVERGGLVLGLGDAETFSILYAQEVLGLRRDVQFINVKLLAHAWYVAQKRRERPDLSYEFSGRRIDTLSLISRELRRGVPVYLATVYNQKVVSAFAGYPVGPLIRLLPPGAPTPSPAEVLAWNERLFRGFSDRGRRPERETDLWATTLLERYAETWRTLARGLLQTGDRRGALRALARAHEWAPWLPVPEWFGPAGGLRLPRAEPR